MDDAIASGISRRKVYRLVNAGTYIRLHEGVFLTNPVRSGPDRWKAELAGYVLRGGPGSLCSHETAARLLGLEGITGEPISVTVPRRSTLRGEGVHRTSSPDELALTVEGLATTSVVRTICDLATVCPLDVVEQALESALRGPWPERPDIWKVELFAAVRNAAEERRRRAGGFALRTLLGRRTERDRPTGSFPETLLFQALRSLGVVAVRQASVRLVDAPGFSLNTFFPDLSIPAKRLVVEVDSLVAHGTTGALRRDLQRQNKLMRCFRVLRYPASVILADAGAVASEVLASINALPDSGPTWSVDGVSVSYTENEFRVVDPSRNAREESRRNRRS